MFDRNNERVRCGFCHWTGTLDAVDIEMVHERVAHRCPACRRMLRIPERLSPCRDSNDRFSPGFDDDAGSAFRSIRISSD